MPAIWFFCRRPIIKHSLSNDPPPSMGRTHTARIATLALHDGGSEKRVWRGMPDVWAVYYEYMLTGLSLN
jgi:hypothetical protein